jgi:hypothetical protein
VGDLRRDDIDRKQNDQKLARPALSSPAKPSPFRPMNKIKINAARMSVPSKLVRGQVIIEQSTGNPNVPGNQTLLAAFATMQAELSAAQQAAAEARGIARQRTTVLTTTEIKWRDALNALAAFTESATGGAPVKLQSAGFDIRAEPGPTPLLGTVFSLNVRLNGSPGHARLKWKGIAEARGYLVEGSADWSDESNWRPAGISMRTSFEANGATPGQPYWYRVAAFNTAGIGPWSAPASRPVM